MNGILAPLREKDKQLDMVLTPKQQEIDNNPARVKVISAGSGFGKTFYAVYQAIKKMGKKNSVVIYVGPTFAQVKRIVWERMKDEIRRLEKLNKCKFLARKPNETELSMRTVNGSVFYLIGADNVDIARGIPTDHVILEEAAMLDPDVWYKVLEPRTLYKNATVDFISTPRGFNWFKDIYDDAKSGRVKDWAAFHYTIYDNPFIPKDKIDERRDSCRSVTIWNQEYMAEFEAGGGRVFEEFNFDRHVVDSHEPPEGAIVFRAVDFGLRDDTVCHWMYLKDKVIHVFDSYVQSDLPASAQAQIIRQKTRHVVKATVLSHDAYRVDPELRGISIATMFVKNGIQNLVKASKNKAEGIDLIRDLLRADKLKIHRKCDVLIKQLMEYEWSKAVSITDKTDPNLDDDAVDALRYGVQLIKIMADLGIRRELPGVKLYTVGGVTMPLRKYPETRVSVESDCGHVIIGRSY